MLLDPVCSDVELTQQDAKAPRTQAPWPYPELASAIFARSAEPGNDGAHDLSHLQRVWKNAALIHAEEGGDRLVLFAATLLHDCVPIEKNSPLRSRASRLSAEKASQVLAGLGWPEERIRQVMHAVEAHSFSAGLAPTTPEARTLQDADRLDAIGMLGVARCFYVAGRMGSALYDPLDPHACDRPLDDSRYALDHFHTKMLKLASGFQTSAGARMAAQRHERLQRFLDEFAQEV